MILEKAALRWFVGICLAGIAISAFASDERVERNSFLATKADSVEALVHETATDRAVLDRFERHFGMSRQEILSYFGTLHLARLNEAGVYRIYSVNDQGVILSHMETLKAGDRVFADQSGKPILKARCGNAMVPGSTMMQALVSPVVAGTEGMQAVTLTTPESQELAMMMPVETPTTPIAVAPEMPVATTSRQG
ncbi:MAG TPA: hypothetical protein VMI31_14505, partial [Fimbriimonadaceae bacterium]|nr:hypothetical protein [Fimbriimonadaceae bacterium]